MLNIHDRRMMNAKRHVTVNACFWMLEAFALLSLVLFIFYGNHSKIALSAVTLLLLYCPQLVERLFGITLSTAVHIFALFYAIGPLLGHTYNFYYMIPWWDNLLHFMGGVVFALLGYYLPDLTDRQNNRHSTLLKYLSAICLSLAAAVVWEFFEYGMDQLFHTDMQNDTIVNNITSYYFGSEPGVAGTISDIQSVIINGVDIGLDGYLDIGLHDTMIDMLVCALGMVLFCLVRLLDKSKREYIDVPCKEGQNKTEL